MEIKLKERLGLILFIICSSPLLGQNSYEQIFEDSIKEISWSCGIAYLPSAHSERTILKATPNKVKAVHTNYKFGRFYNRKQRRHLNVSKSEFAEMVHLYNSLTQQTVDFPLSLSDKDSLRSFVKDTLYDGDPVYKLRPEQLEKYLEKDSIKVDMTVFEIDSLNDFLHGIVIDGAPFRFQIMTISNNDDTTVHNYDGNLAGGDRYRDLPDYLIFSTINSEFKIYKYLPLDSYFSRSNFLRAILRYLEGKEGLLEFKPFEFILEDKQQTTKE